MDEAAIKSEMRIWALEVLTSNLFTMLLMLDPNPGALYQRIRHQMIEGTKRRTFGSATDAASSDLFSAELEAAVTRLMDMTREQMRIAGTAI
jgi:hypothetical protein